MKKFFATGILLTFAFVGFFTNQLQAQTEELGPLLFNAPLYYSTIGKVKSTHQHKYVVTKGNIILTADTLSLPFIDDFSSNRTPAYKWLDNHITATYYNVRSTCLASENIANVEGYFMHDTSWAYSYNLTTHQVDSVAQPAIPFYFFGIATNNCFASAPSIEYKWNPYYRYTFNTTTGAKIDSTLVNDTIPARKIDTFFYAPIVQFASGQPGTLWIENEALVNNTYAVNPPTIGVATFDALNEYGLPYNKNVNTYGFADTLTSKPINLLGLSGGDSVYLSFFYEGKGLGDFPDKKDSLIVEFKDEGGIWRYAWADTGYSNDVYVTNKFKDAMINVPEYGHPNSYFHPTFQFRFRNKASLYGNNDHWHIDYVKLDKSRTVNSKNFQDIAFVYPFPTILKNYTLEPADQFNYPADLRDTMTLLVHNIDSAANVNPSATNFVKGASEIYPASVVIANDVLQTFNASEYSAISINPSAEYAIPTTAPWPVDSLVLTSKVNLGVTSNTGYAGNDTLYHTQRFDNTMAYDDGSAERTYGISGNGQKKFAYEFILNHPDTLAAIQIQYSQAQENVSDLIFNIQVWDNLQMNNPQFTDVPVLTIDNKKPFYVDSVNGFATYKLDTPLIFPSKLYIGWAQTDTRLLQIGYDLNSTLGRSHMFIYGNGIWKPSTISVNGSPMIRAIFDSNYWGENSLAVSDLTKEENIGLYPNPTAGELFISSDRKNATFDISVMDMAGRLVKEERNVNHHLGISELQNGLYLLNILNTETGKVTHRKVIKTSN